MNSQTPPPTSNMNSSACVCFCGNFGEIKFFGLVSTFWLIVHCCLRTSKTHARKTCTCVLDVRYHNCSIVGPLTLLVSFSITTPFEEPDCSSVLKFGVVPLLYFTTSKKVGVLLEIENNAGDHVKMNKFSTKKYNGVR